MVLISAHIGEHKHWCQYICNRPISGDNTENPTYQSGTKFYSLEGYLPSEADEILMSGVYVGKLYVKEQQNLNRADTMYMN